MLEAALQMGVLSRGQLPLVESWNLLSLCLCLLEQVETAPQKWICSKRVCVCVCWGGGGG